MTSVEFRSDPKLERLLKQKSDIERQIETIIRSRNHRFSRKKFVADLGEYYFYTNAIGIFENLKQSKASNDDFDFIGVIKKKYAKRFNIPAGVTQRIEVKTRYDQRGANHLFGLKPAKFDILAFVSISDNYRCHYIGLLRSTDILPDRQNRIVFSRLVDRVFWPNNPYSEIR